MEDKVVKKFVEKRNEQKGAKSNLMRTVEDLCKVGGAVGIILTCALGLAHAGKDINKRF